VTVDRVDGQVIRKFDALQVPVPSLDAGLEFYRDRLGHEVLWRTETAAGLRLPETDAEIVLQTERPDMEVDLYVESADAAARVIVAAGGSVRVPPFDIAVGRCVVVEDPFGNPLVLLDMTTGPLPAETGPRHG
jgi:predicted enzyme related to lactoylglutathione lyase